MSLSFVCSSCSSRIKVAEKYAGRPGKCPQCRATVTVPQLTDLTQEQGSSSNSSARSSFPIDKSAEIESVNAPAASTVNAGKKTVRGDRKQQQSTTGNAASGANAVPINDDVQANLTPVVSRANLTEKVLNSIQGEIPRVRTSIVYQVAIILVAAAVLVLPVLYVSLIACAGWGVYWHATENTAIASMGSGRGRIVAVILYIAPIFAGVVLVLFMLKPLFASHDKTRRQVSLSRARQGLLFAFIDRLCDTVHAPRPSRVDLDFQVNAAASLGSGLLSIFRRQPVLVIGLPLVAGMTLPQFSGVLAHEFGHFSQGVGMRASIIIRMVNAWFAQVVFQRDDWDDWLVAASSETDVRIGIIFYFARFAVFLSRAILWCFMMASHALSCGLSRQMEFDADLHEIRFSGSKVFSETSLRLQLLNTAMFNVFRSQILGKGGPLSGNPIRDIARSCDELDESEVKKVKKNALNTRTGWFDTHPSDSERIKRAEKENAPGVCHSDLPAEALFTNFDELCHSLMRV